MKYLINLKTAEMPTSYVTHEKIVMMPSEPQLSKCLLCFMPQQRHFMHRDHKKDL